MPRFFLSFILIFVVACVGPTMQIKESEGEKLRPMGLFISSSTQLFDDKDIVHRKFIVDLATDVLMKLLNDRYEIRPLNHKILHDEVFKKYPYRFYINEEKIAQVAKREGCSSCLIVYYAVVDLPGHKGVTIKTSILTPSGVYISIDLPLAKPFFGDHPLKGGDNDMTLHMRCSLYGWLISSDDARIISQSHGGLLPFKKHIRDELDREQLSKDYVEYITGITKEMFMPMIEADKRQKQKAKKE